MNIVYTYGVYDLFHTGHIKLLKNARELGDYLVVGVVDDAAVKKLKGENRPIIDTLSRLELVDNCKFVDVTFIQREFNALSAIDKMWENDIKINTLALGEDQNHLSEADIEFLKTKYKINVIRLPRTMGISTSDIIKKIKEEK